MKITTILTLVLFQCLLSCKNTEGAVKNDMLFGHQDVVMEEEEKPEEPKIEERQKSTISLENLIGKKSFNVLKNSDSIEIANIESVLIEGTDNEYGRKLETVREIKIEDGVLIENILNNQNYVEVMDSQIPFNPTVQFQLKHENHNVVLLFDEKTGYLGFTSVEGQTILKIAEPLKEELIKMSIN